MNTLITGDCLLVIPTLPENSVDSIITDPPYGLDFMGKEWDHGVPGVEFWQAALRVAKPGAILMAFGGTRTFHRLACAIEDAGWELRDTMCWLYGSGFPKSLDISKAIEKEHGVQPIGSKPPSLGMANNPQWNPCYQQLVMPPTQTDAGKQWQGYGTALKPAWEPIIVAMKPLEGTYAENAQKWGVAGLNIDGGRIASGDWDSDTVLGKYRGSNVGKGTSVVNAFGVGVIKCTNPDSTLRGRFPANLLLDEESARLLDEQSGESVSKPRTPTVHAYQVGVTPFQRGSETSEHCDHGGASRFFYTAKASSSERNAGVDDGNFHPTVKPVDLMRYLCKLTKTPTGGVVLDPFMGSGTTGIACVLEHRDFIGIELNEEYAAIARKRIDNAIGPLFLNGD